MEVEDRQMNLQINGFLSSSSPASALALIEVEKRILYLRAVPRWNAGAADQYVEEGLVVDREEN